MNRVHVKRVNREYCHGGAAVIAEEVVRSGVSKGWGTYGDSDWQEAAAIERQLQVFNIGYIDDMAGGWGFQEGGSKFFQEKR